MDFGKAESIEGIDYTLQVDHPSNSRFLNGMRGEKLKVYVGCAKWGRPDWIPKLYPRGTKEKDFLSHYVQHFNSIELNATHYRIFDSAVVEKWRDTAPEGFLFCPKFYNGITHLRRLKNTETLTDSFYESVSNLGEKLGPLFLQLPPNFGLKNIDVLSSYLIRLPKDIPVFLELRHEEWFGNSAQLEDFYLLLAEEGIGMVITDTSDRRDCAHMRLTTRTAFIRFVGNSLHPTDYTRIDDWVNRIERWINSGLKELYFFMHQHEELYSPELCQYLIKKLNDQCTLKLSVPKLNGTDH
jgi:uncharacterized protein YecE (DUF72 family)